MIDLKGNNGNDNIANMNYWPSANVWTSVVNHDVIGGTGDFRSVSQSAIRDVFNNHKNFRANDFNDDTLWWGFAALFQKQAYNDDNALDQARGNWGDVSQQQVSGTSGFGKSFSWPGSCNGKSTDGGVFWKSSADDRSLNAITTGLLMAESAYLYDITGEQQYLDSANKARTYFQNHLINGNGLVQDGINIETCEVTDWVFTYNQGKYIEALAVLYSKTGDTGYLDEAVNIAVQSMKGSKFQGDDGIITEGQNQPYDQNDDGRNFKGIYLRALGVLYRRAPGDHPVKALIKAYVNVQANALLDLASKDGNTYGVNWHGPMDDGYPWGQLAALDALADFVLVN
jgi:predicted alpha-1,6-mannanase (GH76 family)